MKSTMRRKNEINVRTLAIGFSAFLLLSFTFTACKKKSSGGCTASNSSSCGNNGLTGGTNSGLVTGSTLQIPSVSTSTNGGQTTAGPSTNGTTGEFPFPATGSTNAGTTGGATAGVDGTTTAGATATAGGNNSGNQSTGSNSGTNSSAGTTAGNHPPSSDGNLMLQPTSYNLSVDEDNARRELWIGPDYGPYPVTLVNVGSFDARDVKFVVPNNVGLYAENDNPCPNLLQFQTCVLKLHIRHNPDPAVTRAGEYNVVINANYLDANGFRRYVAIDMKWFAKRAIQAIGVNASGPSAADIRELFTQKRIGGGVPAFELAFNGGVRTAICDINNDGHDDLVMAAAPGGGPRVTIVNGINPNQVLYNFFAYDPNIRGGVSVGCGKVVQGSKRNYLVTGYSQEGATHVRVWDTTSPNGGAPADINNWYAFPGFMGGIRVAVGDVDGDRVEEVIVGAGPGGGPAFYAARRDGTEVWGARFAFLEEFRGGVNVASTDLNGDGKAEVVVVPDNGGGPHATIFDKDNLIGSQLIFGTSYFKGLSVAAGFNQVFLMLLDDNDHMRVTRGIDFNDLVYEDPNALLNFGSGGLTPYDGGWISVSRQN